MKEVVYVAELDADVDDIVAAEYLHSKGVLKELVLDPIPKTEQGKQRKKALEDLGIKVSTKMPGVAKYVFVGGALGTVASYLVMHKIEYLVMNGGFVGCNIMEYPLKKFEGKKTVRTFNFNCNIKAADTVLKSPNIGNILLVGKNVCHNGKNTMTGIWKEEEALLKKYHVRSDKRMHDLLACREGLILIGELDEPSYLEYETVYPYNEGLNGNMTKWGSTKSQDKSNYRCVMAAVDWK